jgi:hypothetical protein
MTDGDEVGRGKDSRGSARVQNCRARLGRERHGLGRSGNDRARPGDRCSGKRSRRRWARANAAEGGRARARARCGVSTAWPGTAAPAAGFARERER